MILPRTVKYARLIQQELEDVYPTSPQKHSRSIQGLLLSFIKRDISHLIKCVASVHKSRAFANTIKSFRTALASSGIPNSLYAHYVYGRSQKDSGEAWNVARTEWDYVHELGKQCKNPLGDHYYSQYGYMDENEATAYIDNVEEKFGSIRIILDYRAIEDMVIPAVEAFLIPKTGKRKGSEIYGICAGMSGSENILRGSNVKQNITNVYVTRSIPSMTADGNYNSVSWTQEQIDTLMKTLTDMLPAFELVGDFHTHPYPDMKELKRNNGWEFSDGDKDDLPRWNKSVQEQGHQPYFSLVTAIAVNCKTSCNGHYQSMKNALQISVGGCKLIIHAYRILSSGKHSTKNIELITNGMKTI